MRERLHLLSLDVYRRLPTRARRQVVRTIAPTFTVGAMCFIQRADGRLLLVRHVYRQNWGVAGGLLERGEAAATGACREVREEVGIEVDLIGEPAVVVAPEARRVDVIFTAVMAIGSDPDEARPCSPEISDVGWFPRDDLPELQHETVGAMATLERAGR